MDKLILHGPTQLSGTVAVSGSKNAALPLIFCSLLFDGEVNFTNVPRLWDIETTLGLLESMGAKTHWNKELGTVSVVPKLNSVVAAYDWVRKMRAGILALGPLVARYGEARVSLPGGCAIGARPVNFHLQALEKMGVKVFVEGGYIRAQRLGPLKGAVLHFPQVTVTGTENLLMIASLAEGTTVLENAAREPEVIALGRVLQDAGISIEGLGTSRITLVGGKLVTPKVPIRIPPDRIETGTWIAAAAATKSELRIVDCDVEEQTAVLAAFRRIGVPIQVVSATELAVGRAQSYEAGEFQTEPYPGLATDMQAQLMVNLCLANGVSRIRETIFENRFLHVAELRRMGARISTRGNLATIKGPIQFQGAPVMASDLRASASLVLAGLCAKGVTEVSRIYHLDRGYQKFDAKLRALGAQVERVPDSSLG